MDVTIELDGVLDAYGPLLTVAEVAEVLGLTPVRVRRLIAGGALPAVRVGPGRNARLRVPKATLEKYLRAHATVPAEE